MDVTIERQDLGETVALVVTGRLDAECAGELGHAVAEELRRGSHAIDLDLTGVSFLSSAGIRVLFEIHRGAKSGGGTCLIAAASEPVRKILDLTRLAPILMGHHAAAPAGGGSSTAPAEPRPVGGAAAAETRAGPILFVGLEPPAAGALRAAVVGSSRALDAGFADPAPVPIPRHAFALGIGGFADVASLARRAGELVAACGAVFYRPPQPFAVVDYLIGAGDLVPEVQFGTGLVWQGLPGGRAGFEPAEDEPAVPFDELATRLLEQSRADVIALVVAAEVQGLVGVELIRPLAEVDGADRPLSPSRDIASRWLSFSREPVYARRTALLVGVACRGRPAEPLASFVRPLGAGDVHGHFHAVVFPHRPLRRGAVDLAATTADLAASVPLAVMHLLPDRQPVLGSGQSELVRGSCWFAPLAVAGEVPA
jgi:anti-sigma B factor antagonist